MLFEISLYPLYIFQFNSKSEAFPVLLSNDMTIDRNTSNTASNSEVPHLMSVVCFFYPHSGLPWTPA